MSGEEKITGISPLMGIGILGTAISMVIHILIGVFFGVKAHFMFGVYALFIVILIIGLLKSE